MNMLEIRKSNSVVDELYPMRVDRLYHSRVRLGGMYGEQALRITEGFVPRPSTCRA
jgi:hypothetical protein